MIARIFLYIYIYIYIFVYYIFLFLFCRLQSVAVVCIETEIIRWINPYCNNYDSSSVQRSFDYRYTCNSPDEGWNWGSWMKTGPALYFTSAQHRILSPPGAVRNCCLKATEVNRKEPYICLDNVSRSICGECLFKDAHNKYEVYRNERHTYSKTN